MLPTDLSMLETALCSFPLHLIGQNWVIGPPLDHWQRGMELHAWLPKPITIHSLLLLGPTCGSFSKEGEEHAPW